MSLKDPLHLPIFTIYGPCLNFSEGASYSFLVNLFKTASISPFGISKLGLP